MRKRQRNSEGRIQTVEKWHIRSGSVMANSLSTAARYSDKHTSFGYEQNIVKEVKYLFVNKVLPTVEADGKTFEADRKISKVLTFEEYLESKPETKVMHYEGQSRLKDSPQNK